MKKQPDQHAALDKQATILLKAIDNFDRMLEHYIAVSGETRIKFSMDAGLGHDYFYRERERASTHSMVKAATYIKRQLAIFK